MSKVSSVITYVIAIVLLLSVSFQSYHYNQFVNKGPRFTAYDGQELCERVQKIEERVPLSVRLPCDYTKERK